VSVLISPACCWIATAISHSADSPTNEKHRMNQMQLGVHLSPSPFFVISLCSKFHERISCTARGRSGACHEGNFIFGRYREEPEKALCIMPSRHLLSSVLRRFRTRSSIDSPLSSLIFPKRPDLGSLPQVDLGVCLCLCFV
jgi:hypothetical protein